MCSLMKKKIERFVSKLQLHIIHRMSKGENMYEVIESDKSTFIVGDGKRATRIKKSLAKEMSKKLRDLHEDILFESLGKIFDLSIPFYEIVHWVLIRTINEMMTNEGYSTEMINGEFKRALIEVLKMKREDINKEIKIVKNTKD